MKKLAALLLLIASSSFAQSNYSRTWTFTWDAANAPNQAQAMQVFQAESVRLDYKARNESVPLDLADTNIVATWTVTGWTNSTISVLTTGSVIQATNGWVRFEATPTQMNLSTGFYRGFVWAFQYAGTTVSKRVILGRQVIEVMYAP